MKHPLLYELVCSCGKAVQSGAAIIEYLRGATEAMSHPYKTREGGATVTIFVPYDCKNNCPFCINKEEYADMSGFSLGKILESIRRMDAITPRCDFVFTGGEPFADINALIQNINREI